MRFTSLLLRFTFLIGLTICALFAYSQEYSNNLGEGTELKEAVDLIDKKEYNDAIRKLTGLIRINEDPILYYFRARAYIGLEYYMFAIDDCDSALKFQCDYKLKSNIHFLRGLSKISMNDLTGVDDMRLAGERGTRFLQENNLTNYVPNITIKKSSTGNGNSPKKTTHRPSNRVPTLKKKN